MKPKPSGWTLLTCERQVTFHQPPTTNETILRVFNNLDFTLTNAQIRVLREIRSDLASNKPMNRLIQGDVGSGKTIVAVLATAIVISHSAQSAIMAPTEILAEQHYQSFVKFCEPAGIRIEILTGNMKKIEREKYLDKKHK